MRKLMIKQLNNKLKPFHKAKVTPRPAKGWVSAIRSVLGMTKTQLGKRLGVSQQRVSELEAAEAKDSVTLRSLRMAADAMDCDFVYAIVPRGKSIEQLILQQAEKIAKQRIKKISHTMSLEQQRLSEKELREQYKEILTELLNQSPKQIWEEK